MKRSLTVCSLLLALLLMGATAWGQLSGTKTVGTGGDYATIAAAIADLNAVGVSGPVTFSLTDATYNETGANLVISIASNAPTATNTVTFKPASGVTPTVDITGCTATAGASQYAGFTLNSVSHVTIDGSNTVDGTTKDLTFTMSDNTNGKLVFNLYANCDTITIKNTVIKFNSPMSSSSVTTGIYANGLVAGVCDSLVIQNNTIGDATNTPYYAVRITGYGSGPSYANRIHTLSNVLTAQMRTVYYYVVGSGANTSSIRANTISNPSNTITGYVVYGILFNTYGGTIDIEKNKIVTVKTNNATGQGLFGISALTAQTGAVVNITNNFIGDFYCLNPTSNTTPVYGIYWQTGQTVNLYYNTIDLNPVNNTTGTVGALRFGSTAAATVKSNIIINEYDASASYGIYWAASTLTSDYNDIYVSGANANVGYYSGAQKTLADWQTASSQDANSKSVAVTFTSATDLHLSGIYPAGSNGDLNLIGTPIGSITTDIDGETRNGTYPYMGADEGTVTLPVQMISFSAAASKTGAILTWKTATETNCFGFEVERRAANGTDWAKVGFVAGAGTSTSPRDYTYTDANLLPGHYVYRIKQLDRDGKFAYFGSAEVEIGSAPKQLSLMENYPNPFNPATTIRFTMKETGRAVLKVYDMTGREVTTLFEGVAEAGRYYEVKFDGSRLSSGTYFYALTNGSERIVKRMMLVK